MNKTLSYVVGTLATLALVLSFVAYNKTPEKVVGVQGQQGPQGERGLQGPAGRDGVDGITKVVTQVVEKPLKTLGSATGPEQLFPYINNNGVRTWYNSIPMVTSGTTTVCSYLLPQATTTIALASMYSSQLASSTMFEIGTAAVYDATTTSLGKIQAFPTGGGLLAITSASSSSSYNSTLVGSFSSTSPRYLNFKVGAAGISGATPVTIGSCKVELTEVQN